MRLAAALAKQMNGKKSGKDPGENAFADAAREVYERAKTDDVSGFSDALRGAIEIALSEDGRD